MSTSKMADEIVKMIKAGDLGEADTMAGELIDAVEARGEPLPCLGSVEEILDALGGKDVSWSHANLWHLMGPVADTLFR